MSTRLMTTAWLALVWAALWGTWSVADLVVGAVLGALLARIAVPAGGATRDRLRLRPLATLRLVGHLARILVEANLVVSREVLTPGPWRLNEGVVAVPIHEPSPLVLNVLTNAVSLIPGTLILEVSRAPTVLYVHVLHLHTVEEVRLDIFRLERLVVRALGSVEGLRDVEGRIARLHHQTRKEASP